MNPVEPRDPSGGAVAPAGVRDATSGDPGRGVAAPDGDELADNQHGLDPGDSSDPGDGLDRDGEVLTGRRLGRYRVGSVVHSGPMSTLYRADDVRLDRPVALKVISPLLAAEEEFRARFVDEARSLSAVDHPHVVPLYDHDEEDDGHLWLAMRWVDGTTLAQAVAGRPMPLARCLALFDQVASALDAVHGCGLVHLDVKPANILITAESGRPGRPEHVYLADFGLTRRGRSAGRTGAGEFVGSPAFAAPEHLRGEPVSAATDLYGLACSLHTALTGRPPYLGSVNEVISAHLAGQLRPASRVRGEVVFGLEAGLALGPAGDSELARALAPAPADRHGSAGELVAAVRVAMHHDARRPGPAAPTVTRLAPRAEPGPESAPRSLGSTAPGTRSGARAVGSVHGGAPLRRVRPAMAPLTEDVFTTSRRRPPAPPRDPRLVIGVAAVLAVLVLVLATVLT